MTLIQPFFSDIGLRPAPSKILRSMVRKMVTTDTRSQTQSRLPTAAIASASSILAGPAAAGLGRSRKDNLKQKGGWRRPVGPSSPGWKPYANSYSAVIFPSCSIMDCAVPKHPAGRCSSCWWYWLLTIRAESISRRLNPRFLGSTSSSSNRRPQGAKRGGLASKGHGEEEGG